MQDLETGVSTNTPYTEYLVTPGKRYRFRVVGALFDIFPVKLSIEGHRLTIIATDGNAVKPVDVDTLEIATGNLVTAHFSI